jgi:hypothetical protein
MSPQDPLDELIRTAPHVSALEDQETLRQLERASIIYGADVSTGERHLFFGSNTLKRIVNSGQTANVPVVALKFDSRTSDLDYFCETVTRAKGSCEFRGRRPRPMPSGAKVRVHDFESKATQEIPASELAPGYVLAVVPGVEGLVYVKADDKLRQPVRRHKDLSEECKRVIRYYAEKTEQVDIRTIDQHLAGFCAERDPVRELLIHFKIAYVYAHFAKHKIVSPEDRRSLFAVTVRCSMAEQHTVMETLDFETLPLPRARIQQIVDYYYTCNWMGEFERLFDVDKMTAIDL